MDTTITSLRENMPSLKIQLKTLSLKLQTLKSAPTTSELTATIEALCAQKVEKGAKLSEFKEGAVQMVTRDEMDRVEKEFKYWSQKRSARKTAFANLEGHLLEGMGREEIWEKVGVEEDTYLV
jgi:26S proteasome regulatory subunit (ATPase 3-interacting protein)